MSEHITLGAVSPRIQYVANGSQVAFTYPFAIFAETDVEVYVEATKKAITTDYTVAGAGSSSGGSVTFVAAPANGAVITLRRSLVIQRTSDFQESGEFRAKVINDELDRETAFIQQVADDVSRAIRLADSDPDANLVLPAKADRASKVVAFDANGDLVVSTRGLAEMETEAEAAAASASAALASEQAADADAAQVAADKAAVAADKATAQAAATAAGNSATAAAASEANAAASAAKLSGTSTSSVAVGTGSKTFTTQSGKFFDAGTWLLVTSDADPANYMHGQATAYSGTGLTVDVTNTGGSGTHADWTIRVSGTRGATGATGATGPQGPQGPQGPAGTGTGDMLAANNLDDLADAATARTNLGVAIGTDVQAHDADLDWVAANVTAAGKALLDDADAAAQRATLGLGSLATLSSVGTSQVTDDAMTLAKLAHGTAGKVVGFDETGAPSEVTLSSGALTLISTTTITDNVGTVSITGIPNTYSSLMVTFHNVQSKSGSTGAYLAMRYRSGGSVLSASSYNWSGSTVYDDGNNQTVQSACNRNVSNGYLTSFGAKNSSDNDGGWCGTLTVTGYAGAKKKSWVFSGSYGSALFPSGNVGPMRASGGGSYNGTYSGAIDGFDFYFVDGNNNSFVGGGIIKVYGIA